MIVSSDKYEMLSRRAQFNESVRHIKLTVALSERVQSGENLADAVNELLEAKEIGPEEILPLVSMLLVDKFGYVSASTNLSQVEAEPESIATTAAGWNAVDLVAVYHHPDMGVLIINPKNPAHFANLDRLNRFELVTVYAGAFAKSFDSSVAQKAVQLLLGCFEGRKLKIDAALEKGSCKYSAPKVKKEKTSAKPKAAAKVKKTAGRGRKAVAAPEPIPEVVQKTQMVKPVVAAKKPSRMTPMYAVPVTNELFHNGNVEAWKRIIESYRVKHPDLDVLVYYDGERITNLNALFKWGKVKHGSTIQFAVAGDNICDVAKLQRYLAQGASPMFEAFLRGPVNGVLALF